VLAKRSTDIPDNARLVMVHQHEDVPLWDGLDSIIMELDDPKILLTKNRSGDIEAPLVRHDGHCNKADIILQLFAGRFLYFMPRSFAITGALTKLAMSVSCSRNPFKIEIEIVFVFATRLRRCILCSTP